ncbi:MAG: GntR family transcriptional regulator [Treponema sp.]|nr:GntR family transcriptional regulator [Treponema sp.]
MDIVINQTSEIPIYSQIYSQISSQIISGTLPPGTKLPGIRQISNELRISVIPVKMAWEELDKNGFIKTITGSGTFVNQLENHELQEKQSQKAQELIKKLCKEAKESGISAEQLIELIKANY